jgi:hypothetical protein
MALVLVADVCGDCWQSTAPPVDLDHLWHPAGPMCDATPQRGRGKTARHATNALESPGNLIIIKKRLGQAPTMAGRLGLHPSP